jgi:hypothetical protein
MTLESRSVVLTMNRRRSKNPTYQIGAWGIRDLTRASDLVTISVKFFAREVEQRRTESNKHY